MTESLNDRTRNSRESAESAPGAWRVWLRSIGWIGIAMAIPFFIWAPLALIAPIPSMIDLFGVVGLRIPASITVAGLLLAAIGFHRL